MQSKILPIQYLYCYRSQMQTEYANWNPSRHGEVRSLFMSLSHPVSITHVTLGHTTKSPSPNGKISSAPREFSIYVKYDIFFYYPRYVLHTCHHYSCSAQQNVNWALCLWFFFREWGPQMRQHFRPWNCRWVQEDASLIQNIVRVAR